MSSTDERIYRRLCNGFGASWYDNRLYASGSIYGKHNQRRRNLVRQMSSVKLFNTALTAAQVADLYNNPEKVVPTGVDNTALKLWLPMQEGAGTTAYDGSGNGNHGTISGATYTHGVGAPVAQTAVIDWNKGTNLVVYSEQFDMRHWTKVQSIYSQWKRTDGTNVKPVRTFACLAQTLW